MLTYQAMDLSAERGLQLIAYTAKPGSASADALRVLASWTVDERAAEDRRVAVVPAAPAD